MRDGEYIGNQMHGLIARLFPICRSLTGNGNRQTLEILKAYIPLTTYEVPSGTKCFDWTVPDEWNINDAYLKGERKYADFRDSNLHVVGYSTPIAEVVTLKELEPHLHSLPAQPDAVPYVTSYYTRDWGFCLKHAVRETIKDKHLYAFIDSTLEPGHMTYADLVIPGKTNLEVLLSTYICHPSMANNELSGPVMATMLAQWVAREPRRFTYRFVFVPETIGAIYYISKHLDHLKKNVVAGFQLTCLGDPQYFSYMPSRNGNTWSDKVVKHVIPLAREYSWLERGSDERQWCAPGVDLPVASVMRSKYAKYPEYHTSKDDIFFVTPGALGGSYNVLTTCLEALELDYRYVATNICEPQLGPRGLYSDWRDGNVQTRMNILTYCDGKNSLLDIANKIGQPIGTLQPFIKELLEHNLITTHLPTPVYFGQNKRMAS